MRTNFFWFRRDLRLDDNTGLNMALYQGLPVIPLFIFDVNILDDLVSDDPRITFIYETLSTLNSLLIRFGSSFLVKKGDPVKIWNELIDLYDINAVYVNEDYEPYALSRDDIIESLLGKKNIPLHKFKDQVIFAGNDILKSDATPYTVFTPYKKRWILKLQESPIELNSDPGQSKKNFLRQQNRFPSLMEIGFKKSKVRVRPYNLSAIKEYDRFRNSPSADKTSYLSPYLRFGTVSIRRVVRLAYELNTVFLNELIWREFFMQILFHFPHVVTANFKPAYNDIQWRNEEKEFLRWCNGETGYPIVDAGMHQLNRTGYMHNRVRMITSSFLCRDLLIDWRWGEAYFAQKLLDYELSSNNGNWQWAAGTGCDAAAYYRIFNPDTQQKKFDPKNEYVKQWVPDFDKPHYPEKIVDHDFARKRAIETYRAGLKTGLY